jgi:hypothetical protein
VFPFLAGAYAPSGPSRIPNENDAQIGPQQRAAPDFRAPARAGCSPGDNYLAAQHEMH